jgi:hypothetical protein
MNPQASRFLRKVELGASRIQFPEDVVFLCGGPISVRSGTIASLRDLISTEKDVVLGTKKMLLAERVAVAFDSRLFDDLLDLEAHIASVSRLVLLISESPGSIAELGAFSQIDEIRENLLVFVHTQHYQENSFIKDGPIRYLLNRDEQSVQEFNWIRTRSGNLTKDSAANLIAPLKAAIDQFLGKLPRTKKFQSNRIGHQILLVAGIVNLLRCSKLREIGAALSELGIKIDEKPLKRILFCLELFGWIKVIKRDTSYYVYSGPSDPFLFRGRGAFSDFDPIRVRFDILNAYEPSDARLPILDSASI